MILCFNAYKGKDKSFKLNLHLVNDSHSVICNYKKNNTPPYQWYLRKMRHVIIYHNSDISSISNWYYIKEPSPSSHIKTSHNLKACLLLFDILVCCSLVLYQQHPLDNYNTPVVQQHWCSLLPCARHASEKKKTLQSTCEVCGGCRRHQICKY